MPVAINNPLIMLKKIWSYITFWKPQDDHGNGYLKAMHMINKISIALFIIALIVMLTRILMA